jgi:hypothetical protein
MKEWKIGEVIGFISGSAFAFTLVYLYGYDAASHLDVFEYLSLNDYFRLAVGWLTAVVVGWILAGLIVAAYRKLEEKPRRRSWFLSRQDVLRAIDVFALLTIVVGTGSFLLGRTPGIVYYVEMIVAGPTVWILALIWCERDNRLASNWSAEWRKFMWYFPAMLIVSFFTGAFNAEVAKAPLRDVKASRIFVLGRSDPAVGRILFNLDDYALLRTSESGKVEAIPRAQVALIVEGDGK